MFRLLYIFGCWCCRFCWSAVSLHLGVLCWSVGSCWFLIWFCWFVDVFYFFGDHPLPHLRPLTFPQFKARGQGLGRGFFASSKALAARSSAEATNLGSTAAAAVWTWEMVSNQTCFKESESPPSQNARIHKQSRSDFSRTDSMDTISFTICTGEKATTPRCRSMPHLVSSGCGTSTKNLGDATVGNDAGYITHQINHCIASPYMSTILVIHMVSTAICDEPTECHNASLSVTGGIVPRCQQKLSMLGALIIYCLISNGNHIQQLCNAGVYWIHIT